MFTEQIQYLFNSNEFRILLYKMGCYGPSDCLPVSAAAPEPAKRT